MTPPMNGPTTPIVAPSPLADSASEVVKMAAGLSEPMRKALDRLVKAYVYIDGRSREALIRRGLARKGSTICDALLGTFVIVGATDLGRQVAAHLLASQVPGPISNERGDE